MLSGSSAGHAERLVGAAGDAEGTERAELAEIAAKDVVRIFSQLVIEARWEFRRQLAFGEKGIYLLRA